MNKTVTQRRDKLLNGWAYVVSRYAPWIVVAAVVLVGVTFNYTSKHLRINTNTGGMFSPDLAFRKDFDRYQSLFPQFKENLVVVIDGETPEAAALAARELGKRLSARRDLFKSVYLPRQDEFLVAHGLLYLKLDKLQDLSDNLAQVQPYLGKLTHDPSLRGLLSMLEAAAEAQAEGREIDLSLVFSKVGKAIDELLAGRHYRLSWQELIARKDATSDDRRQFIILRPQLDYGSLFPAAKPIKAIRKAAADAGLTQSEGVRVRLTGGVALSNDELHEVSRGAGIMFGAAFVMVVVVLLIGLRSLSLLIATVITLVVGLMLTAAFAAVAVGHLNLISVAFSVLYIGLGVDYSIHFCLRYAELTREHVAHRQALCATARDVGTSLLACAISTAVAFYAFLPTSFSGVSELGLISGTGMFISLAITMTLLPALLTIIPLRVGGRLSFKSRPRSAFLARIRDLPLERPVPVRAAAVVLFLLALVALPRVRFDWNPLNLRDPSSESVSTFRDLLSSSETPPWHLTVLAPDAAAAARRERQLARLPEVGKVISALDFVPSQQEAKLDILDELSIVLGLDLDLSKPSAEPEVASQVEAVRALHAVLGRQLEGPMTPELATDARERKRLYDKLGALLAALDQRDETDDKALINGLQDSLLSTLGINLKRLRASLAVSKISANDVPKRLRRRWIASDGTYRVAAFPNHDLDDSTAMESFVEAGRRVDPHVTGAPVVMAESGKTVITAFQEALGFAVIATGVILVVVLRSFTSSFLVLVPLLLAGALTGAVTVLFSIPFNFANVIALPLLLGIGVDNGIHIVHRTHLRLAGDDSLLRTSTARGVVFSALTTICSFGNLSFSSHVGTASMGQILLIGMTLALICSLVVLPSLLVSGKQEDGARTQAGPA